RELLELRGAPLLRNNDALSDWIRLLCEDVAAPGRIDLSVAAGLLRLAPGAESAEVLAAAIGDEPLIEAFLRDPVASAPLLSPRCLPQPERRTLLGRLCAKDP